MREHCPSSRGEAGGLQSSTRPTAVCEKVEPTKRTHGGCALGTRSIEKGEQGGMDTQVTHGAGRHADGTSEVKGKAEPPKTPVTVCRFP